MGVAQVVTKALLRPIAHRLDTDLDSSAATLSALLQALGAQREGAIVHVPDGQRQRG